MSAAEQQMSANEICFSYYAVQHTIVLGPVDCTSRVSLTLTLIKKMSLFSVKKAWPSYKCVEDVKLLNPKRTDPCLQSEVILIY